MVKFPAPSSPEVWRNKMSDQLTPALQGAFFVLLNSCGWHGTVAGTPTQQPRHPRHRASEVIQMFSLEKLREGRGYIIAIYEYIGRYGYKTNMYDT